MTSLGTTFYMPMLWPFGHIIKAVTVAEEDVPPKNKASPLLDPIGNFTSMVASARSFAFAWLSVFYFPGLQGMEYPAFGIGEHFEWRWMWPILLRNILGAWLICGFWDWFLYFSPLKNKLHKYKMNHRYPSMAQMKHDAFYTTLTSCWAAVIEILLCHWWANGTFSWQQDLWETPVRNAVVALMITHYRIPHFYLMHRMIHPWKTTCVPDVGKFLYKHVHSLHHKSYNPTAFSGTSMHPVEGTLYYTAAFIPVFFNLHPVFAVATVMDSAIGAWLGHDGFRWPGSGDYFHQLHHQHFDGNYGAQHVPLDWLFGTFISCKEDVGKIWRGNPAGEEANETMIYQPSVKKNKVE